ncbi:DUF2238 domain-containing protein [Mycoplasmatota bacterium WC44]
MAKIFKREGNFHIFLLVVITLVAVWSGIKPYDTFMWFANGLVAFVYAICFVLTYKRFKFTSFSYILIFIHLLIIFAAAKYTYENARLFSIIKEILGSSRNNFDRIGHFFQGFIPIILTRELFLRNGYMKKSRFFYLVIIFFVLAISASWELLEFIAALIFHKSDAYILSTQGDIWDAQWDMVCAIFGAVTSLLIFSRYHDKKISEVNEKKV